MPAFSPQPKVAMVDPTRAASSDVQMQVGQITPADINPQRSIDLYFQGRQRGLALQEAERQNQAAKDAEALRTATIQMLPPGATEFDVQDIDEYRTRFGRVPLDAAGKVDMAKIRTELENQKSIERALGWEAQRSRILYDQARATGRAGGTAAGDLKPSERLQIEQSVGDMENFRGQADRILEIVNESNVVGPARGSDPGRFAARVWALFGDGKVYEDQRTLEMIVNENILKKAANMKGQLSDRDVRFLQATVPKLMDTEKTWSDYARELQRITDKQIEKTRAFLDGRITKEEKDAPVVTEEELNRALEKSGQAPAAPGGAKPGQFFRSGKRTYRVNDDGSIVEATEAEAAAAVPKSTTSPSGVSAQRSSLVAPTASGGTVAGTAIRTAAGVAPGLSGVLPIQAGLQAGLRFLARRKLQQMKVGPTVAPPVAASPSVPAAPVVTTNQPAMTLPASASPYGY